MQRALQITIHPTTDTIHEIEHLFVWRSHERPDRRACIGTHVGCSWSGWLTTDDLQDDSSVYIDAYATGPGDTRYIFATAYAFVRELLDGAPRTSELVNVYTGATRRNPLGTATFVSGDARMRRASPAFSGLSLRDPQAFRLLKAECVRLSAARAMDGAVVPEMMRLYIDQFDNSTQFPLPTCMFFRMARPDGRDLGPTLARYLDSAVLCRGWTDGRMENGLRQHDPEALDVLCDALCCVAYTIPYQSDYAPVAGRDLVLDVDAYEDPLQTGRGDCEDFALLILRLVLFAQRAWRPQGARDRAAADLLRMYVAAATMRTVNAPSMDGGRSELSGHMNVALYPRSWFNRASDVRIEGPADEPGLPTLFLEGTGSMWGPLTVETPASIPRARPEAVRHGWRGRMFHSRAPIDRATDPFGFMRHAGLIWVPDAPPGREQMHLCTVRGGHVLYGASLEDEVRRAPEVRIVGTAPPPDEVLALMARAETHLPPLVDMRCDAAVASPVLERVRRLPGWRPLEDARGRRVAHFFASTETTGDLDFLRGRSFTAFAEQLAPRVARVNILVFQ